MTRLTVPWGIFGYGNIGDEAMLQGFATLLRGHPRKLRVSVASQNPQHDSAVEPSLRYFHAAGGNPLRRRFASLFSRAWLVVGDTPVTDVLGSWPLEGLNAIVRSAQRHGKPIAFVGGGSEPLRQQRSLQIVSEMLAPTVTHWSVRAESDKERLVGYGVDPGRITVAADLAWLVRPVESSVGENPLTPRRPRIAVNLTNEAFVSRLNPRIFVVLARFLDVLAAEYGARIVFVSNEVRSDEQFDQAAARLVIAMMRCGNETCKAPNRYFPPQEMLSLIAGCDFVITMRYHCCLFAALQSIPFLALKRSSKLGDICNDLAWPFAVDIADLDEGRLVDLFIHLHREKSRLAEHLSQKVAILRERSWRNRAAIEAVL